MRRFKKAIEDGDDMMEAVDWKTLYMILMDTILDFLEENEALESKYRVLTNAVLEAEAYYVGVVEDGRGGTRPIFSEELSRLRGRGGPDALDEWLIDGGGNGGAEELDKWIAARDGAKPSAEDAPS